MNGSAENDPRSNRQPHDPASARPVTVSSEQLLCGENQILIVHGGEVYRLFRTKNNKLMLQK